MGKKRKENHPKVLFQFPFVSFYATPVCVCVSMSCFQQARPRKRVSFVCFLLHEFETSVERQISLVIEISMFPYTKQSPL
jgi:hypothetical protein